MKLFLFSLALLFFLSVQTMNPDREKQMTDKTDKQVVTAESKDPPKPSIVAQDTEQQKSQATQPVVQNPDPQKSGLESPIGQTAALNSGYEKWRFRLEVLTVILAVAVLIMLIFQHQKMIDQLSLAHPPRIAVTSLMAWEAEKTHEIAPRMLPGVKIQGRAYAINIGREGTTVTTSECFAMWYKEGMLPMIKPHTSDPKSPGKNPLKDREIDCNPPQVITTMKPGKIGEWSFETEVPAGYPESGERLFIIGQVLHRDRLDTRRAVFFAREYDVAKQRFVKVVDNPDYESEEQE